MTGGQGERARVSIVVPVYNEEARLPALFETLRDEAEFDMAAAGLSYAETVLVDDGSTDASSVLLDGAAAEDPRIRPVLGRTENVGKGRSVREGVMEAQGDWVLIADTDLSTPLGDAIRLHDAARAEGAEIAIGSRARGGPEVQAPMHRRFIGTCFNRAVRASTGLRFSDTQSGFKLARTAVAREALQEQICTGFSWDVEFLLRARRAGVEIAEVPVSYEHDDRSQVRIPTASLAMARDLIRLRTRVGRAR